MAASGAADKELLDLNNREGLPRYRADVGKDRPPQITIALTEKSEADTCLAWRSRHPGASRGG